jgi:hypothetical protein
VRARAAQRDAHPNDHFLVKSGNDMIPVTRPKPVESRDDMMSALKQRLQTNRAAVNPQEDEGEDDDGWKEEDEEGDGATTVRGSFDDVSNTWTCGGQAYRVEGLHEDGEEPEVERLEWVLRRHGHVLGDAHKAGVMHRDELFALVDRAYTAKFHVPGTVDDWWCPDADAFDTLLKRIAAFKSTASAVVQKRRRDEIWELILEMPDDASVSRTPKQLRSYTKLPHVPIYVPKPAYLASVKCAMSVYPRHSQNTDV